ncbi:hypothetical protein Nmel_012075, partial [Mimus melanotis]
DAKFLRVPVPFDATGCGYVSPVLSGVSLTSLTLCAVPCGVPDALCCPHRAGRLSWPCWRCWGSAGGCGTTGVGADLEDDCPAQLLGRPLRWDRHVSVQLVPHLEQLEASRARRLWRHRPHSCSALSLRSGLRSEPHERSISPWRYRIDEDENRYPPKLAFAECLCSGCVDVKTGRETTSLNSVAIHQTMLVLRRKPCPGPAGPGLVTLEAEYIKVPVGCTCVLPRTLP